MKHSYQATDSLGQTFGKCDNRMYQSFWNDDGRGSGCSQTEYEEE